MALSVELKKTTVFITHDLDEAIRIGSRIAIMKDGRIVQIGTPEEIVTRPADDYVRDFVQGISRLKLVYAHTIMVPMDAWRPTRPVDLSASPRTRHDTDLDRLIDIATATDKVIVINDAEGNDIGVVDQVTLLKGIQGGKA
jgi:glycine betaine/proline transport system ATP-binding protein